MARAAGWRRTGGGAAGLGLLAMIAACGGSDGDGATAPAPAPTATPTPAPTPTPTPTPPATGDDLGTPDICQGSVADQRVPLSVAVNGPAVSIAGNPGQVVRGFNFRAFITSTAYALERSRQTDDDATFYRQSYQAGFVYGQQQIDVMKSWGVTTVRFQISQTLTAANDAGYRQCITNAVRRARNSGLLVILAMQWQKNQNPSGLNRGMPTELTLRAWRNVDAIFRDDSGIAYELFNEPVLALYPDGRPRQLVADAATKWRIWNEGDGFQANGQGLVGHQRLVDLMRSELRTDKLLIADGLNLGDSFEGLPASDMLNDPLRRLAYAVHPYPRDQTYDSTAAQFDGYDRRWGFMRSARGVPILVTEWAQGGQEEDSAGASIGFRLARDLVNYANTNAIPLVASAFDVNGPINTGLEPRPTGNVFAPSNFDAWFAAGRRAGNGAGILLCRFMQRGYQPAQGYTDADLRSARLVGEAASSPCLVRPAG